MFKRIISLFLVLSISLSFCTVNCFAYDLDDLRTDITSFWDWYDFAIDSIERIDGFFEDIGYYDNLDRSTALYCSVADSETDGRYPYHYFEGGFTAASQSCKYCGISKTTYLEELEGNYSDYVTSNGLGGSFFGGGAGRDGVLGSLPDDSSDDDSSDDDSSDDDSSDVYNTSVTGHNLLFVRSGTSSNYSSNIDLDLRKSDSSVSYRSDVYSVDPDLRSVSVYINRFSSSVSAQCPVGYFYYHLIDSDEWAVSNMSTTYDKLGGNVLLLISGNVDYWYVEIECPAGVYSSGTLSYIERYPEGYSSSDDDSTSVESNYKIVTNSLPTYSSVLPVDGYTPSYHSIVSSSDSVTTESIASGGLRFTLDSGSVYTLMSYDDSWSESYIDPSQSDFLFMSSGDGNELRLKSRRYSFPDSGSVTFRITSSLGSSTCPEIRVALPFKDSSYWVIRYSYTDSGEYTFTPGDDIDLSRGFYFLANVSLGTFQHFQIDLLDYDNPDARKVTYNTSVDPGANTRPAALAQAQQSFNDLGFETKYYLGRLDGSGEVSGYYDPVVLDEESLIFYRPFTGRVFPVSCWWYVYSDIEGVLGSYSLWTADPDLPFLSRFAIILYLKSGVNIYYFTQSAYQEILSVVSAGLTSSSGLSGYSNDVSGLCSVLGDYCTSYDEYVYVVASASELECEHDYTAETLVEATCIQEGQIRYTCSLCGNEVTLNVPKLGHTWEVVSTTDATCSVPGEITYTCSVCGESYIEEIPTTEHEYDLTDTVEPTCVEPGYYLFTCDICGDEYREESPALGHRYVLVQYFPSEYDDDGNLVSSGYSLYRCSVCGDEYTETDGISDAERDGLLDWLASLFRSLLSALVNGLSSGLEYLINQVIVTITDLIVQFIHWFMDLLDISAISQWFTWFSDDNQYFESEFGVGEEVDVWAYSSG